MNTKILWKTKTFGELSALELYKLLQIRVAVFIIEQDCIYQDLDDTDQKAVHLWAEENGQVIAYCRLFDKGIKYDEAFIGRVLTAKNRRKEKLGRQLMKRAIEIIESQFKTAEIRISAQDYLIRFYEDFGFVATDKKYLEDNLPHTEMFRR